MTSSRLYLASFAVVALAISSSRSAHAQIESVNATWNFENAPNSGWFFSGNSGYDINQGHAHSGNDNVWVNATQTNVWNAVNVEFYPGGYGGSSGYCNVSAFIQTSSNFVNGVLNLWADDGGGSLTFLSGGNLAASTSYTKETFNNLGIAGAFQPQAGTWRNVLMDFGFWGTGQDQWVRVDDVSVQCYTY